MMLSRSKCHAVAVLCTIVFLFAGCKEDASQDVQGDRGGDETRLQLIATTRRLGMNDTSVVEIHLDNVDNLYGLQFSLQFDPTMLQVQDADAAQEGVQIAPGTLPAPDFAVRNVVDNERGTIDFAVVQLNPREPAKGSGVVATIRFEGVAKGISPLNFFNAKLADPDGQELPVQLVDAELEVN